MRFLIDEDVPVEVADLLAGRQHEVVNARDRIGLGRGKPDTTVASAADADRAIVVTCNYRHFRALISRREPTGGRRRYRHAGLIALCCEQGRAFKRLANFITEVEDEYRKVQGMNDKRLIVEIHDEQFRIVR